MKKIPYSSCVLCTAFFVLLLFFLFLSTRSTRFASSSWAQESLPDGGGEEIVVEDTRQSAEAAFREAMYFMQLRLATYKDPFVPPTYDGPTGPGGGGGIEDPEPEDPCEDEKENVAEAAGELAAFLSKTLHVDDAIAIAISMVTHTGDRGFKKDLAYAVKSGNMKLAGLLKKAQLANNALDDCEDSN